MPLKPPLILKENMKKILHKLRRKKEEPASRITSNTVSEHREQILAGGRKFKYPIQYAKHKLVINAILIILVAFIAVASFGWYQLYSVQNTSELMYRVTKVIPFPIARVDGEFVLYSDYLMIYRSSIHFLEKKGQVNLKTDEGKKSVDSIKQQSMQSVIQNAFAAKLAREMNISVSDDEVNNQIKSGKMSLNGEVSEQTYYAVLLSYYDLSPVEYSRRIQNELLRQKVSFALDKDAETNINEIADIISKDSNISLKTLAETFSNDSGKKATFGASGWVPKNNNDYGLTEQAVKLSKGQASQVIKSNSGDGYYIVRLIDINDTKVSYEYIKVPLTAFSKALNDIISTNKVDYFISIPKTNSK